MKHDDSYLTCGCATCASPIGPDCRLLRRAWDEVVALRAELHRVREAADRRQKLARNLRAKLYEAQEANRMLAALEAERDDVIRELADALRGMYEDAADPDDMHDIMAAALARVDALTGGER